MAKLSDSQWHFFVDVRPDQIDGLEEIATANGVTSFNRGRCPADLSSIGVPPTGWQSRPTCNGRWGDRGITYSASDARPR